MSVTIHNTFARSWEDSALSDTAVREQGFRDLGLS